ncbi:MAG: hypothetical protein K0S33_3972 [Bacteroidetes bacterium]|nr:hypothetical protein [Bacteroidota bacterium]
MNYKKLQRSARISSPVLSCLLLCLLFLGTKILAQQSSHYTFSTGNNASLALDLNGNTIDMSTGTTQLVAANVDDASSAAQGLDLVAGTSFTFRFMGTNYTTFSANDNGVMALGATVATNAYTIGANTVATIAPFGNDMKTGTNGKVHAKIFGSAPNRTLVIEWQNVMVRYLAANGNGTGTFQIRLYETSNNFEYVYGDMATNTSTPTDYYIGFSNNTTVDNVMSVNTTTQAESVYYITNNSYTASSTVAPLHSTANGSRRYYLFTAPDALTPLNGPYTVDNTMATGGLNFRTIKDAVRALNVRGISGPVTFNVTAGQTFSEEIMPVRMTGTAANTITFQKSGSGANPEIRKAGGTFGADAGIYFRGGDYYTFDGINVTATNTTVEYGYYVFNTSATDGAQNNTIKNCTITLNRTNTSSRAIYQNVATTPTSAAGANSNNKYYNLNIRNTNGGILLTGNATFPDLSCEIGTTACNIFNSIGDPAVANDIGNTGTAAFGIRATNQSGVSIFNNNIRNVTASSATIDGIFIETFQGTSSVYNNKIQTIRNSSTTNTSNSASGIRASHTTTGTHALRIYNNAISEMTSAYTGAASATRTLKGIYISGTGGAATQSYQIYNNTVAMNGSGSLTLSSVCFEISTASGPVYNLANNIFANLTPTQAGTARHLGIFSTSATAFGSAGTTSNNNNIFILNDAGTTGFPVLGNATNYNTVAAWTTASTYEAASLSLNPNFTVYPTDLHAGNGGLDGTAAVLQAFVTNDLDCAARTDNDFGAYNITTCTGTPTAGTISGVNAVCSGLGTTLGFNGTSTDAGVVYQWASSATPGGPYTTMLGTLNTQATGNLTASTYYILTATCIGSGLSATTPEKAVLVNANPVVGLTSSSPVYCFPAAGVSLTASNAATYTWTPVTGLSATTGANVSASPTANTTYTVTGTDGNGCIGTANIAVASNTMPFIASATATPSSVCSGGNSQLQVIATGNTSTASTYSFSAGSGTYTPIGGTVLTGGTMLDDDVGVGNLPIGFNFSYNGNYFTVFGLRSNGLIELGQTTATLAGFAGNALATNANCIAPLWDDNNTTGATVSYQTTGTAPNRILTVQWTNLHVGGSGSGTNPTINMQILLYEASGRIQFVYGSTSAALVSTSASIGISGAVGNYKSVTPLLPVTSSTVSSSTENTGINSATNIPSGTIYTFDYAPVVSTNTYTWTPSTFLNDPAIVNPIANGVTSTTVYTVSVSNGVCTATGSVTVNADPLSAVAVTATSTTLCAGASSTLTATPTGGGTPYTYVWMPGGVTTNTVTVSPASSDVYTVTVNDACGATSSNTVSINVNALPVLTATATANFYCTPGSPAIAITANGADTYTWLPAAGLSATTGSAVNANPASSTTYTVTGTDLLTGCVNTATVSIAAVPAITGVTASVSNATICAGDTIDLTSTANSAVTFLTENFNGATNSWTTTNTSTTTGAGNVALAAWTLRPNGHNPGGYWTSVAGISAINSNDASQFYLTNSDVAGSGNVTDVTLTSPRIDVSIASTLNLSFYHFFRFNAAGDYGRVQVSTDGTTWTTVQSYTATTGAATNFAQANLNLNTYVGNDTLYIRYTFHAAWGYGWAVDNVVLNGTATNMNYAWTSAPAGFTSAMQNPVDVVPTASTSYSVTVSNTFGCSASATTSVTVNAVPTVSLGNDTALCAVGLPVTLNAGNAGAGFLWSTTATTQTISVNAGGSYHVAVTDANGCVGRDTLVVTANPAPVVALGTDTIRCGGSVTLDAANAGSTYEWNDMTTAQMLTVTASGTYSVVVTDANGCEGSDVIDVTINDIPVVSLGNDTALCSAGLPLTLDAGNAGADFLWSTTATTQTISANAGGSYDVVVTGTNGCVGKDTLTVTVNASPVVALGTDTIRCGGSVTLDAGNAGSTYEWNDMTTAQTLVATTSGTYSVMVTDGNGCEGSDAIDVTINTIPTVTLGNDTTVCVGALTLDAGNAGADFLWNTTAATQTINVSTNGQYFVEVTNAQNCSATDTITVTFAPAIDVNLGNDSAICASVNIVLDAQNSGSAYVWNDNSNASVLTVMEPGIYFVEVTSAGGCVAQDTIVFTDNSPLVTLSLPFTTTCENIAVNPLSGGAPANGIYSGTGVTGTNFNAGAAGNYDIIYTYTDGVTGCSSADTQTVVVDPCIGVKDLGAAASISVAPNPTTGYFSILSPSVSNVVKAEMYTVEGQLIYSETLKGREEYEMNITNLPNAIYYLRLTVDGGTSVVKVVKQQ